jgi:diguanylate cyclase (GGDEF)-like protein
LIFTALAVLYVSALSAGSIAHYAAHMPAWLSFAVPCLLPLMLLLAASGEIMRITLSVLLLIYFAFLLSNALRIHETIMNSLLLRFEKDDLLRYLQEERTRAENLNRELQADIEQRKKTEEELRNAKEQAEKLAEQLLDLSSQDGLTGIANRRRFDEFLRTEWGRAARRGAPLALIIGDIDHYKAYNDYYGHQAGDDCLIRIARLLQDYTRRGGELAARYGGEEFAILLADTGLYEAVDFAEQLRAAVENLHIRHERSPTAGVVTMSFGVAALVPSRNTSPSALIKYSDEALYAAKKKGRNRVETRSIEDSTTPDARP